MDTTLLCALLVVFSVLMYALLDGFDLGVGILLLSAREESERDQMVESIAPTWDGNETWLILAAIGLFAGFPAAYSILLPIFYGPLLVMLMALGLRGVSFEFRFQTERYRRMWDYAFCFGSIAAALAQGLVLGTLIQGEVGSNESPTAVSLRLASPFSVLTALAVLANYVMLGAAWINWKTEGGLQKRARVVLRWVLAALAVIALMGVAVAFLQNRSVTAVWHAHSLRTAGFVVCAITLWILCWKSSRGKSDALPFFYGLGFFLVCLAGWAWSTWPYVLPYGLSFWDAASHTGSQKLIVIGAAVLVPVILAYSGFAYFVFRGKVKSGEKEL